MGEWWLPDTPDNKIAGTLTFSQEQGAQLDLFGDFHPQEFILREPLPLVLGTAEGKLVTLDLLLSRSKNIYTCGLPLSRFLVHRIYVGIHAKSLEHLVFNGLQLSTSYFIDWLQVSGFSHTLDPCGGEGFSISYETPIERRVSLPKGELTIRQHLGGSRTHLGVDLHDTASIVYEKDSATSLLDLLDEFWTPMRSFLTLGTNRSNFIDELYLSEPGSDGFFVECYFAQQFYSSRNSTELYALHMPFTFMQVAKKFPTIIYSWFESYEDIDAVMNLFLREMNAPDLYLELRFLTLVHALETYHLRRKEKNVLLDELGQERNRAILESCPAEYQPWLKDRLANTTSKSLNMRVSELFEEKADIFKPFIGDLGELTKLIGNSRNYYTHFSREKKKKAADGINLHSLTLLISLLLKTCLMDEMGIDVVYQKEWIEHSELYGVLQRNSAIVDALLNKKHTV